MLIGDIWLYKRQAYSQHLLESGNLKFNPLVSAEPARRDDGKSYTSPDRVGGGGGTPPASITVM